MLALSPAVTANDAPLTMRASSEARKATTGATSAGSMADEASLGRRIRRSVFGPVLTLRRRRDDDAATCPAHHQGSEYAQHVSGAIEVDADLVMPVPAVHLQNRLERLDAGVREDDAGAAPFPLDALCRRPDRAGVPLVRGDGQPAAAGLLDGFPVLARSPGAAGAKSRTGLTGPAMSVPATAAPRRASVTAAAHPMPRAAPVITATGPVRSPGARWGAPSSISMSSLSRARLCRPRYPVSRRQSSRYDLPLLP
jgi:hypothetical protein